VSGPNAPAVDVTHASALWFPRAGLEADCMIVDPPYSAKVHDSATSCGVGGLNDGRTQGVRKRDLGFASLTPALRKCIATYATQVRRWSAIYSDIESVSDWIAALESAGAEYVRTVPWVRWSQPQLSGDRPPSGCEMVILAHRAERTARGKIVPVKKRWNGPGSLTHLNAASLRGTGKHPTEKPLDDILRLVSWLSDPGETVLDPCCGAGTTVLAAALLGRGAVGLERDAAWAEYAEDRLIGGGLTEAQASGRDAERVARFVEAQRAEASAVPAPKAENGSDVRTWERAQRRLADAERAERYGA
jgi:site-specific DNA-methyltransferase (adenine-specific)